MIKEVSAMFKEKAPIPLFLSALNARMTGIRKERAYENGVVERSPRIDDEEFLNNALRWIYLYNIKRAHFGRYMNGNRPYEKLKSLLPNIKRRHSHLPAFHT